MSLAHSFKTSRSSKRIAQMTSSSNAPSSRRISMIDRHFSASASNANSAPETSRSEPSILFEAVHSLRKAILNRPKALNSLNDDMIGLLQPQLEKWEASDLCGVIMFKGAGKHFCAGGDVKSNCRRPVFGCRCDTDPRYEDVLTALASQLAEKQTWANSADFFAKEYATDHYIANMKTPVISVMTGNTLGGGCGLSMHAPFRIATETTVLGMPETNIGLFPDVGANFFLPRLDGQLGVFLGLTGHTLRGKDAFFAGFASHYVPGERLEALEARLCELTSSATYDDVNSAIEEFVADANELAAGTPFTLTGVKRRAIDLLFSRKTMEEIVAGLDELATGSLSLEKIVREGEEVDISALQNWAKEAKTTIEKRSPTSLKLTLKAIREGAKLNIDEVFAMDLRIATACCNPEIHPDFRAGVTHLLVHKSKDRAPWTPSRLEDVSDTTIQRNFFANPAPFSDPPVRPLQTRVPRSSARPFQDYPHARYSLPSEQLIRDVVTGEAKGSGKFALTANEVVKRVAQQTHSQSGAKEKVGLREKVLEVIQRKCKVGEQGTLKWA